MHNTKQAFSFVEIIITISIITLLAVIWISANQGYKDNMNNTKIISDVKTINNALEAYVQENTSLPMPWGNTNSFKIDTSYSHSYKDPDTFWVYGSITEDTLPNKYLNVLPLDPRTNSYYSYWKTGENVDSLIANQFELASVQNIEWEYQAFVTWNYTAEAWPYNLIREYNGSSFVYNKSKTNLPYNPEELILIVTDENWVVYREWQTITVNAWDTLEIFFSDGSVSVLWNLTEITTLTLNKLNFPKEDNLNTLVKLSLWAWTIWTKATNLNTESEFEIYTTDSTAAVRGTIFWVSKDSLTAPTEVFVVEWEVEIYENETERNIIDLKKDESIRVIDWQKEGTATLRKSDFENIENKFIVKVDIRGTETVAMIDKEIEERKIIEEIWIIVDEEVIDYPTTPIYTLESCMPTWWPEHSYYINATLDVLEWEQTPNCDWTCNNWYIKSWESCVTNAPTLCSIWEFTNGVEDENLVCTATEDNIIPWVTKTVYLTWAFEIEMIVDSIPTTTQYLLYGWNGDIKLFFGNWNVGAIWDVCYKKSGEWEICKPVIIDWTSNEIIISRNQNWDIYLNFHDISKNVSWTINSFYIWRAYPNISSLRMDSTNKIDITIER